MERMIFQAESELLERARRRARERGVSVAQVIRDALQRDLGGEGVQPRLSCIGSGQGTGRGVAERIDELYEPDPWRW